MVLLNILIIWQPRIEKNVCSIVPGKLSVPVSVSLLRMYLKSTAQTCSSDPSYAPTVLTIIDCSFCVVVVHNNKPTQILMSMTTPLPLTQCTIDTPKTHTKTHNHSYMRTRTLQQIKSNNNRHTHTHSNDLQNRLDKTQRRRRVVVRPNHAS